MNQFTETQVKLFEAKASVEKYFTKFVWYNRYLQITYVVPQSEFKGFKVPQWSMVSSMTAFEDSFVIIISLFNDENWLYDINAALKAEYPLITFKLD